MFILIEIVALLGQICPLCLLELIQATKIDQWNSSLLLNQMICLLFAQLRCRPELFSELVQVWSRIHTICTFAEEALTAIFLILLSLLLSFVQLLWMLVDWWFWMWRHTNVLTIRVEDDDIRLLFCSTILRTFNILLWWVGRRSLSAALFLADLGLLFV